VIQPTNPAGSSIACSAAAFLLMWRMRWTEVRAAHPDQWLVIEALDPHSENDHRVFDRIAVIETCPAAETRTMMSGFRAIGRARAA
jgi:hypothetical protein